MTHAVHDRWSVESWLLTIPFGLIRDIVFGAPEAAPGPFVDNQLSPFPNSRTEPKLDGGRALYMRLRDG